ncbi:MAG: HD-GYP domain-containing protein [Treponema sp.]|jgi:HD-GYP domain-containing protein (c-di-GMP phosphodiesterase class II)|nr:HD-GYP domain-containing protein [Treponema sp.]
MKSFSLGEIPPGSFFTKPVYLDSQFVVAAPETPFSKNIAKIITDWQFKEVFSDGEPCKEYTPNTNSQVHGGAINKRSSKDDNDKIQKAEEFYTSFQEYVENLFAHVTIKNELNFIFIAEKIKTVCDFVRENRRFLMRAQKPIEAAGEGNYLAAHTVRSTVIALIIGTYLKLPSHRLIELGVAALVHEIGMLKLPPQIYLSNSPLGPQEKKMIYTHPELGYNLLRLCNFPLTISLAALEHHERENGSGYPRQITGSKISLYSKIIAVACSYEGLISNRPHKEAKNGYAGMLELLKNEGKQYDDIVVRALIYSLSIYPIGLYVSLSNGKNGQVIDVNPENPRYPVVQIFGEVMPDGTNKTLQTSPDGVSIVRPLRREEIESQ